MDKVSILPITAFPILCLGSPSWAILWEFPWPRRAFSWMLGWPRSSWSYLRGSCRGVRYHGRGGFGIWWLQSSQRCMATRPAQATYVLKGFISMPKASNGFYFHPSWRRFNSHSYIFPWMCLPRLPPDKCEFARFRWIGGSVWGRRGRGRGGHQFGLWDGIGGIWGWWRVLWCEWKRGQSFVGQWHDWDSGYPTRCPRVPRASWFPTCGW